MMAVLVLNICVIYMHSTEDCDCSTTIIAASVTLVAVISVIIIINLAVVVFRKRICRRKSELHVEPKTEDGTVRNNPAFEPPVDDVTEEKSQTSVSPQLGEGGQEQRRTMTTINQSDAGVCQSSSATGTEEGAPVSDSVVRNTTGAQAIRSTITRGASMNEESHPSLSVSPTKRKSLSDQVPLSPKTIVSSFGFGSGFGSGNATKPLIKENHGEESDADSDEHTQ